MAEGNCYFFGKFMRRDGAVNRTPQCGRQRCGKGSVRTYLVDGSRGDERTNGNWEGGDPKVLGQNFSPQSREQARLPFCGLRGNELVTA